MVADKVAVVRALFESTQQRDIEEIKRLLDPSLVWEAPPSSPGVSSRTYRGVEGYLELLDEVGSEGGVWMELLDIEPSDGQGVLASVAMGTAERGGMRAFLRFLVVNGRVIHARTVLSRDELPPNRDDPNPGSDR